MASISPPVFPPGLPSAPRSPSPAESDLSLAWAHMWTCIHIIAISNSLDTEDSRHAFVCFLQCMGSLCPDQSFAPIVSDMLSRRPPSYFSSSKLAFAWTYDLHVYVARNRRDPVPSSASIVSAYSSMSKTEWSDSVWFVLHWFAAHLPPDVPKQLQHSVVAWMVCLGKLLPCPKCRAHMMDYMSRHDLRRVCSSGFAVFEWTVQYHNEVSGMASRTDGVPVLRDPMREYAAYRSIRPTPVFPSALSSVPMAERIG